MMGRQAFTHVEWVREEKLVGNKVHIFFPLAANDDCVSPIFTSSIIISAW